MSAKTSLFIGSVNALIVIAMGAFGAHALAARLSAEMMETYQTGIQYHFYHALGLLIVGMVSLRLPDSALVKWSAWLMLVGIVLFSGSLYVLSLSGIRWFGAITPFGGTAFLVAWLLLAVAAWKGL